MTSGNAVICNVSRDPGVSCRDIGAKRFQFGYTDTLSGSLAFKIVPLGTSQIQLSVVDIKT